MPDSGTLTDLAPQAPNARTERVAPCRRGALLAASAPRAQARDGALRVVGLLLVAALAGTGPVRAAPDRPPLPPERTGSVAPDSSPVPAGGSSRAPTSVEVPLPPVRGAEETPRPAPASEPGPAPSVGPVPATGAAPIPAAEPDCAAGLAELGIVAEAAPQPAPTVPACQVEQPMRLVSVADPGDGGRPVPFPAGPVIACRLVRPLGAWLATIALPVLRAAHGAPVRSVQTGPGSDCRTRDHIAGERLSAHATGIALDIAGFTFADGKSVAVKPGSEPPADRAALAAVRTAACGWFTTILGPGSDPYHADHLHLDIQQHGSSDRYRICQ